MADAKKKTADEREKKKKALLRKLRDYLLSKSKGGTLGSEEKQIKELEL